MCDKNRSKEPIVSHWLMDSSSSHESMTMITHFKAEFKVSPWRERKGEEHLEYRKTASNHPL